MVQLISFSIQWCRGVNYFLILLGSYQLSYSQTNRIDSFKYLLNNCKSDTTKVYLLCKVGGEYYYKYSDMPKGLEYAKEALALADRINYKSGIANTGLLLARIYYDQGNFQDAEIHALRSSEIFKELNSKMDIGAIELNLADIKYSQGKYQEALIHANSCRQIYEELGFLKDVATAENIIGLIYYQSGQYSEALSVFSSALEKFIIVKDSVEMADVYINTGNIYLDQGNSQKAMENSIAALKIYESKDDKINIAKSYGSIGDLYLADNNRNDALNYYTKSLRIGEAIGAKELVSLILEHLGNLEKANKNYSAALDYYQQSLTLYREMDEKKGISTALEQMGELYSLQGLYTNAIHTYHESLNICNEIGDQLGIASLSNRIGKLNLELNHPDSARNYFLQALPIAKSMKAYDYLKDAELGLYNISMSKNDYKEALNHYMLFTEYSDSIFDSQKSKQMAEVKVKFESELKYRQIKLQSLELGTQKRTKNYLIAFSSLFVIISFLIYREYYNRQHLKLQNLRNKIASDLHDDVGSTLSSISIFSQIAQRRPSEVQPLLQTIEESSKKMLDAMADIVWTIKPENDQFEKIILRMRSFSYELLGAKQIQYRFIVDDKVGKINISMESRRNLYLIFKEATNNMVKYSNATKAEFSLKEDPGRLIMKIQDNGIGFDQSREYEGNGLKNMHARAREIGASLSVNSSIGNGTHIQLILEI